MRYCQLFIACCLFFISGQQAFSQTKEFDTEEQLWLGYFNQTRFTDKSGTWLDLHLRFTGHFVNDPALSIARAGYTYYVSDHVKLTAAYAYATRYSTTGGPDVPEHRPWQQIQWTEKKNWFTMMQWVRLEERFRRKVTAGELIDDYSFNYRIRYNMAFTIPLKGKQVIAKTPFLFANNEVMINFGKEIVYNYFDQNRAFVGFGYQFTSHLNAQLGYMYVFQQLADGNKYLNINAIRLFVFHNLDLRKKDLTRAMETPPKPTFKEAFNFWLKLGFISFGGPAGQIAIMHEFLVTKKKWISDSRFLHALNYCMILPGPEAQQLATYIGWLLHGTWGGIVAGSLFVLPSLFILLGLSIVYVSYGTLPWVASLLYGLKPAVIAIIILALIKISKKSLISPLHYGIAVISFVLILFFKISFPLIILGAILIGLIAYKLKPSLFHTSSKKEEKNDDESSYFLNRYSPLKSKGFSIGSILQKTIVGLLLWATPLVLFYTLSGEFDFWKNISFFFSKAALVTFGGAYAVLPYVAQVSVDNYHWLSSTEMMDGLALGETTPGPLIMILVFVGFLAGFHHSNSLAAGTLGLMTTAYYTFLPSFLFILIGAPLVEATQENKTLKSVLAIVTAAVVGVILNLTFYFGQSVLFQSSSFDWFALVWLLISFIALYRFKFNMIWWIVLSAVAGFIYQYIS